MAEDLVTCRTCGYKGRVPHELGQRGKTTVCPDCGALASVRRLVVGGNSWSRGPTSSGWGRKGPGRRHM